jgi:FixJ family two-component response regulator
MTQGTVHVLDDDDAVRESLSLLCEAEGLQVKSYPSAEAFLSEFNPDTQGCIVLDVRMGDGMSGPKLHAELNRHNNHLPVIYLTGVGTIPMTVQAMKAGAFDFLTKPVDDTHLLRCIHAALRQDHELADQQGRLAERCQWLETLTAREREIMQLAVTGHTNKAIARQLGISYRTVELHRSRILHKSQCNNLVSLSQLLTECEAASVLPAAAPDPRSKT